MALRNMRCVFPLLLVLLSLSPLASATTFHVAPSGSDANPGTEAKPFATLERAREAVRQVRQNSPLPGSGVTVQLSAGDHVRTNTFELSPIDSGTEQSPITWQARAGQPVRLLGARKLSGFQAVTNPTVLARLVENARSHVREVDLRALGITDFGEMHSRGFGRSALAHCELFFDGKPMTLARWPNEGEWERIAGFPNHGAQDDGHKGQVGKLENGFYYRGDRPRQWQDRDNIWVHGYWAWDWANSYERVVSFDLDQRWVKTAPPFGQYGFRKDQRYYFLNVLEELDQPGEWFLDRKTGRLYFWPPDASEGSAQKEILLSLLGGPLLQLSNVSHVTIRGLTLEATRGNAIEINGGSSNRIADCLIRNIGNGGITIAGGTSHGVSHCQMFDTGDGGVSLQGGERQTLVRGNHFVEHCHFARQGRWSKCYVPAVQMGGVGLRVSHNLIHDHPHCAILFTGNEHLIEFNEIHHIALETGDVGAIYTGRDYTYRGNRIRHNYIHHTGGVGLGAMGIYMDDCVSGTEIYGNVFYKVQRAAFLGGGRDHQVVNNIFVDCNYAVELDGRGLDTLPVWRGMVEKTMRENLAKVPLPLYRESYPALKSLDRFYGSPADPTSQGEAFKGIPPENNLVARNICVGKWLKVYWHATEQMLALENNLTNAASAFAKPINDKSPATDFQLSPDSPAWKLGFQQIPLDQIGPR